MRLNLGCGNFPADGWVNVDCQPRLCPDVVADLGCLPFDDGSADAVYAGHVFEHVAFDVLPAALFEVARVLRSSGTLMVVGPDLDRAVTDFPERVPDIVHGAGRWPGDAHLWDCTETLMLRALVDAGWDATALPIADVPATWPVVSRVGWQFAIECR